MGKPLSNSGKGPPKWVILILIIVIVVAALAIYAISRMPFTNKPTEVTLTGTVTTTGTGTMPEKITFTSMSDQKTYVAAVSGGGNPGTYGITLPNQDSYKVTITWKFWGITGGNADAGTLNLDTTDDSIVRNWAG